MQYQATQSHMCIDLNAKQEAIKLSNWLVSQSTKELDFAPSDAWLHLIMTRLWINPGELAQMIK